MRGERQRPPVIGPISRAEEFAAAFNVSRETISQLTTYETLLRQWQKAVNLVAPSTLDEIWHRHFADCAQLLRLAPHARTWVDLGSGAGFPGLVIGILMAESVPRGVPLPLAGKGQGGGDRRTLHAGVPPTPNPSPQGGGGRGPPRLTLIESNAR